MGFYITPGFYEGLKLAETQSSAGIDDISGGLLLGLSMKGIRRVCAFLFLGNEAESL